jgi:hypothetical protein
MRVVPLSEATDAEFESSLEARRRIDRDENPTMTPMTPQEWRYQVTDDRRGNRHTVRFGAIDDEGITQALTEVELSEDPENSHICEVLLEGRDDGRHLLLSEICDIADREGRTTLIGWCELTDASNGFWTSQGLELVHRERQSALSLESVDLPLMVSWINRANERSSDVTLEMWTGWWPDHLTPIYIDALGSLNDVPVGGLDMNEINVTEAAVRRTVGAGEAAGEQRITIVAHQDGVAAGVTTVIANLHRPDASWQAITAVSKAFRERGIGRLLKASMCQHLVQERPEISYLRTFNASGNDAMLAINNAMGFRETVTSGAWQASVATVRETLV